MGVFIRIFFGVLAVIIIGGFVINKMPEFKQRVVEVINPAAKEARILGELDQSLDDLEKNIDGLNSDSKEERASSIDKNKDLISRSKSLLDSAREVNAKNSGIIKQQVGKIIDALLDGTPFPADHLRSSDTATSPLVCPPQTN
ncbi:MAG: hypothetical protein HY506_00355 [Candidatus Yanofskybacteria bacterium]|nr:hypothetical protein [Candidatus Yanofskybacteria bacterium]